MCAPRQIYAPSGQFRTWVCGATEEAMDGRNMSVRCFQRLLLLPLLWELVI
jgi:hypothetical protein